MTVEENWSKGKKERECYEGLKRQSEKKRVGVYTTMWTLFMKMTLNSPEFYASH